MFNAEIYLYDDVLKFRYYERPIDHVSRKNKSKHWTDTPFPQEPDAPDGSSPFVQGFEVDSFDPDFRKEESLRCSVSRTRSAIRNICLSFKAKYFVTFTFDQKNVNRYSYDDVSRAFQKYLASLPEDTQYIVVPELHKDGAYHFHGLFSNICTRYSGKHKIKGKVRDTYVVNDYKLGYTDVTKVKSAVACARYIVKYITKDLCAVSPGKKRYWFSKSTINVVKKVTGIINDKDAEYLIDCLKLSLSYDGKGSFYESDKPYAKFTEMWLKTDTYADILAFFHSFDVDSICFPVSCMGDRRLFFCNA